MAVKRRAKGWNPCRTNQALCCTALAAFATVVAAAFTWEKADQTAHAGTPFAGTVDNLLAPARPSVQDSTTTKYKIFTFWDYPAKPSPWVYLNLETWRASSPPGTEIVLVNNSNFKTLVPDAPEEWFRLPYAACKSDVVRAAVLFHHGGLYIDTDYLALGNLGSVFSKLDEGWDIVAYSDEESTGRDAQSGACNREKRFSSNFMGARKENPFSKTWWTNIKSKLTRTCGEGEYDVEKVCCHEAGAREPDSRPCHIPWAHLEWLKNPVDDADSKGPPGMTPGRWKKYSEKRSSSPEVQRAVDKGNEKALPLPTDAKLYCLMGPESVAPHLNGEAYWQPWDAKTGMTVLGSSDHFKYDLRFGCKETSDGDLDCAKGNWGENRRNHKHFFRRLAFHLFFSTRKVSVRSREEALQGDWLISELYRRALAPRAVAPAVAPPKPALAKGPQKYNIYGYWDFPHGVSPLVHLNRESWLRHAPKGVDIILVNDTNFRRFVPDAPEEWFRLPYAACKSDVVKAAVLYHHGGLYLDTDFLAMKPLQSVFDKLDEGYDIVAHQTGEGGSSGACSKDSFSSSFMGAKRGNHYSETWWENIKAKLRRECSRDDMQQEKVCCREAGNPASQKEQCHVPWQHLDLIRNPKDDPDAKDINGASGGKARNWDKDWKAYCMAGEEGLEPHESAEAYWQPWTDAGKTREGPADEKMFDSRFQCQRTADDDLSCERGSWGRQNRVFKKFFNRMAVHLVFSNRQAEVKDRAEALNAGWLLSSLYKQALGMAPAPPPAPPKGRYDIYTYWDYPHIPSPFVQLNVDSWIAHAPPGTRLIRVNDSNIRTYVPDIPEEWFRLPYAACKSDVIRASVLYHQGGLYMDTDFLVQEPLSAIFAKLDAGYDVVAYSDESTGGVSGDCDLNKHFSSNFMAARKGNPFSATWWHNTRHKITRMCAEGEFELEKVCCHEAFTPASEKRPCHIPWAYLEWLKVPKDDPDGKGPPGDSPDRKRRAIQKRTGPEAEKALAQVELGNVRAKQVPEGTRLYCLRGPDGMAPHLNGEVFWQPWDAMSGTTLKTGKRGSHQYDMRFKCKEIEAGELSCNAGNWGNDKRTMKNFFHRTAVHLFFSTRKPDVQNPEEVLRGDWLLSELYRRTFSAPSVAKTRWTDLAKKLRAEVPSTSPAPAATQPPALPLGSAKYNIITYWDYPHGPPPFVQLNIDTWMAHAPPGAQLLRVNDTNFKQLVPDAPEEVFRLPYPACKSDVVRAAVLYHQGGLYMDTDYLVGQPLEPIFKKLAEGWDIVTYSDDAKGDSGVCDYGRKFSSNFMAGRKGNVFSKTWWTNIKHKLTRICAEGEFQYEKVCCHEAFAQEPEHRRCHIPWAHLEWLKIPQHDSDGRGPYKVTPGERKKSFAQRSGPEVEAVLAKVAEGNSAAIRVPDEARLWCLRGPYNVAPHFNGEVYWQPWDLEKGVTLRGQTDKSRYDMRFECQRKGVDLECDSTNWGRSKQVMQRFFSRTAYHLFFSTRCVDVQSPKQILEGNWLISELYRNSFTAPGVQSKWREVVLGH